MWLKKYVGKCSCSKIWKACDDRGMQELLREVSKEELLLALKAVEGPLRDKFFANMSSRAAESLKEDMETSGPSQAE